MNKKLFIFVLVGLVSFSFSSNISAVTWTPPTAQFPAENTQPPIDIGDQNQTKGAGIGSYYFDASGRTLRATTPVFLAPANGTITSGIFLLIHSVRS
ncbi:MAG: hypothetical protein JST15_09810 [Bacteroidetes bacterium]|nr:hypothetical protein [Bacteroidota bacterium]